MIPTPDDQPGEASRSPRPSTRGDVDRTSAASPAPRRGASGEVPTGVTTGERSEPVVTTVVWDLGGIFRDFFTEAMLAHGRARGWPLERLPMGPTGDVPDPAYDAMGRGELGEHAYLDRLLASLAAEGIEFDPLAQPSSFFPDRPSTWALFRELGADPDRRQAILTNDASRWLGAGWWRTWPHRHLFDAIVDSTMVDARKPSPAPYREVLSRLGGPDPATCLFVDDMPVNVEAARALGLRGLVFDITDPVGSIDRVRDAVGLPVAATAGRHA